VAEGINSLSFRERRTILNRISNLARVNPTHTLGMSKDRSEATVSLIFRVMDQGHHKRLQDRTHTNCAGHTSVARLHDCTPVCYAERTPTRWCVCTTETKIIKWWRHVHLPGQSGTRLTAYGAVHYPYSDCKMVNMQLLYRASDRKSLDFCRSY
jgi:hypothetical protein